MTRLWTILGVVDVTRSTRWYQRLLGLPTTGPAHTYFGQVVDSDGAVLVCLHSWGERTRAPTAEELDACAPGQWAVAVLRVKDFAGALERASKMVATLAEEPHVNPATGTQEFALCDPDGYYVMVSAETAA